MAENSAALIALLFGLIAVSPEENYITGIKICGLAPRAEVQVKLSDDTLIRKTVTNKNGTIFIKRFHKSWIVESTFANGKRFHFKVPITPKSSILQVGCSKLL